MRRAGSVARAGVPLTARLSDVIAGMLEGVVVACLVWCAVEALRDRRAVRANAEDPAPTES